MYGRILDLREIVRHKSVFLFGPRQTGKSTMVRQTFPDAAVYDLLEADTFRELTARPEYLRQTLSPSRGSSSSTRYKNFPPSWMRFNS